MTDLRAYAHQAAERVGIDGAIFERQIDQESGFNPDAYNAQSGASGIAQIIPRFHPGVDVWNPEASLDYAATWIAKLRAANGGSYARALASYNWGPGNVSGWDGRRETLPAETRHYLDVILGPDWSELGAAPMTTAPTYDPTTPPERQVQDWACSIRTATWMLKSIGIPIDAGTMQGRMTPQYVTPDLGLLDGRGYGLAEALRACVGASATVSVHEDVSWDDLHAWAGTGPIGIGSASLYHWLAVREPDDEGTLSIMNPAPAYHSVGDQLTRAEFDQWAPWNAVRMELQGAANPPPPPAVDLAPWINALSFLGDDIGDDLDTLPAKLREAADTIQRSVDQLRRVRTERVGPRPA